MGFSCRLAMALFFFLVLFCSGFGLSSAALLKVGDTVGWSIGKIDYATWASQKTFHVGDVLLFAYNNTFHNVLEVKKSGYEGCTATSPISKYATGNDSVTLKSAGDHYFICGFPGHCDAGQKLKVTVLAKGSSAAPSTSPIGAPSPASFVPKEGSNSGTTSSGPAAASPKSSNAAVTYKGLGFVVSTLAVAAVSLGFTIYA